MANETRPLLSRVADSVYWMARYIERAENVARFIDVNLHLQLDLPLAPANQWQPLIETTGDMAEFTKRYGIVSECNVIQFLDFDEENPNSIFSCVRSARENARSVRETISSEMWEQVNSMYLQIQIQRANVESGSLPEVLRGIRMACHMFQGITDATMSHNEAWHFLRLGRMIERADKTSRILDVKYFILLPSTRTVDTPYDDLHWSAVLKSVSGFEMYRKKYGRILPRNIVELLIMDREFPRAILFCIIRANESLHAITGTSLASSEALSEQLMTSLTDELNTATVDMIIRGGLHEYLDRLQTKMNAVGDGLLADFFVWRPVETAEDMKQTQGAGSALMAIRVALHHRTIYEYDRLVELSPQIVRLRPAPHSRTPILSYSLQVEPHESFHQLAAGSARQFRGSAGLSRANPTISHSKSVSLPR